MLCFVWELRVVAQGGVSVLIRCDVCTSGSEGHGQPPSSLGSKTVPFCMLDY